MARRDADLNLLFGINALQNDFITRDALIAGMAAWAREKPRPLGDTLVERRALDPAIGCPSTNGSTVTSPGTGETPPPAWLP